MVASTYGKETQGHRSTPDGAGYPGHFEDQAVLWDHQRQSGHCFRSQLSSEAYRGGSSLLPCPKEGIRLSSRPIEWGGPPIALSVNVICPGLTRTQISENTQRKDLERIRFPVHYPKGPIPLGEGKPATAEQVAQLVLFLVSDAASHITGTEVWIEGGSSLITG
jgi:hypothetical protein